MTTPPARGAAAVTKAPSTDISQPIPSDVWTADQTAQFLHLSARTVREMARRGDLPASYLGGRWHFDEREVRDALRNAPQRATTRRRRRRAA